MKKQTAHLVVLVGCMIGVLIVVGGVQRRAVSGQASGADLRPIRAAMDQLKPLHASKIPPVPGNWLAAHDEPGQTFEQYLKSRPNRPTAERTTLYIQPIGTFDETQNRLLNDTADSMGRFFGLPVKTLQPLPLEKIPGKARRVHPQWRVKQILSTYVLDEVLEPRRPDDAVAVLALTTSDLWPGEGWNFVFGQASLTDRVGVWSLARYGDPGEDYPLVLRRTIQTATHETGHMLGILHCTAYECGMNGSNSLDESDRAPLAFCPECDAKLWWACGLEPAERYASLVEFAEKHELAEAAKFWRACADALP